MRFTARYAFLCAWVGFAPIAYAESQGFFKPVDVRPHQDQIGAIIRITRFTGQAELRRGHLLIKADRVVVIDYARGYQYIAITGVDGVRFSNDRPAGEPPQWRSDHARVVETEPAPDSPASAAEAKALRNGVGTGFFWSTHGETTGNVHAQANLTYLDASDDLAEQDYIRLAKFYTALAGQGWHEAEASLGSLYSSGSGVPRNYAMAVKWYRLAAEGNDPRAQALLGWAYDEGRGVAQDKGRAFRLYLQAAEQNDPPGQFNVAYAYHHGDGVRQDFALAASWYRKAAEQGDRDAALELGQLYLLGAGVARDPAQAVLWFRQAAQWGNVPALNQMGIAYENGAGVSMDLTIAAAWYRLGADLNDPDAQSNLANLLEEGVAGHAGKTEAYKWWQIIQRNADASDSARSDAQQALLRLTANMSPGEIAKAQDASSEWQRNFKR